MTEENKAANGSVPKPPTIKPRSAAPRPVPPPSSGPNTPPARFDQPSPDAGELAKIPQFTGGGSSPIAGKSTDKGFDPVNTSGESGRFEQVGANEATSVHTVPPTERDLSASPGTSSSANSIASGGPTAQAGKPRPADVGSRKVRLAISRIDPWSVMKLSFLLSVALGIITVVASWVFWYTLNNMGVFSSIDELVRGIVGDESELEILQYVGRDRVTSLATLIAVIDVVLLTALSTIGAFLYNVVAALVGGIHLTMTDE